VSLTCRSQDGFEQKGAPRSSSLWTDNTSSACQDEDVTAKPIECMRALTSSLWLNDPVKDQVARSVPLRVDASVTLPWRIYDATGAASLLITSDNHLNNRILRKNFMKA
jgi:hypothetical protein